MPLPTGRAATWAARAASEAAWAATPTAAWAAARAARAAAWDRITDVLLDGIELECGAHRREDDRTPG
jgi:hypothetical protein